MHYCVYVFHESYEDVDEILAKFNENLKKDPYIEYTKEQAIAWVRKYIEDYKKSDNWKEWTADPEKYKKNCLPNSEGHIEWLEQTFPKMLTYNDEECYEWLKQDYAIDGMVDEQGNLLSTRNPYGHWDWYEVGGRWGGTIPNDECRVRDLNPETVEVPFAFVDLDGNWHEKDWQNNKEKEWETEFRNYFKSLKKLIVVTQVDVHS